MVKARYACAICGKGIQKANLVSFSKNRVHIFRKPNLHSHRMTIGNETVRVKLCTSCKRAVRAAEKETKVSTAKSA